MEKNKISELRRILKAAGVCVNLPHPEMNMIIDKVINHWLPTQEEVDFTMGGLRVYSDLKTNKGKRVNYGLCITSELAELLDSIPWKHWKDIDATADLDNYKTEQVDLLHFLPSTINAMFIQLVNSEVEVENEAWLKEEMFNLNGFPEDASLTSTLYGTIEGLCGLQEVNAETKREEFFQYDIDKKDIYLITSRFQAVMSGLNMDITNTFTEIHELNDIEEGTLKYPISSDAYIRGIFFAFVGMMLTFKLYSSVFKVDILKAVDELWNIYLVKNVLNIFRINNGYREGTYSKMWNGEEDNTVVKRIADKMIEESSSSDIHKGDLYALVEEYYTVSVVKEVK